MARFGNAKVFSDRLGRQGVVARNHDRANACLPTFGHSISDFGPGCIQHSHQTQPGQTGFGRILRSLWWELVQGFGRKP
jgi:hypothetical protein